MPSVCMMSASNPPPPLPVRGNLPPLRKGGSISRTASAVGRPLPATPKDGSATKNNAQTLSGRNKKSPVVTNYENHEIRMGRNKSSPAELNKMTFEAPPPPPSRLPKQRNVSCPGLPNSSPSTPTGGSDLPPALPSRGPPRKPSISGSSSSRNGASSADLEARFPFHDPSDFPPPDMFEGDSKAYASKKANGQQRGARRRKSPDFPPE
ncbi:WAS/WASL-interacting protein family member 1-like [Pecten maximus]|uniref:WAS/WASL-interacting protein family member 1-like n=1 Tax=Pecten maximus TaxID=6579 RepID=UPI001458696D|nr:WAS/WASL-interacting protein family member 1-like [Pecten maximus]XP_033730204.1 WAS/WASL-interacting protein family member 1-like [Pecten maximus]